MSALLTLDEALDKRRGKRLAFTNGVFDLLHVGHVEALKYARAQGDLLLVGINSDASVKRLGKGPERPLNPAESRAAVLAELRSVDGVLMFEEDWPGALIQALKPEVYVKSGDYQRETLPETPVVEGYGGQVVIAPFLEGFSTTDLVRRMHG